VNRDKGLTSIYKGPATDDQHVHNPVLNAADENGERKIVPAATALDQPYRSSLSFAL